MPGPCIDHGLLPPGFPLPPPQRKLSLLVRALSSHKFSVQSPGGIARGDKEGEQQERVRVSQVNENHET